MLHSPSLPSSEHKFTTLIKVIWRHVAWGMMLQFILGLIILRWPLGRSVFDCVSGKVATFLAFTDRGASFVFGDLVANGIFAFTVRMVVVKAPINKSRLINQVCVFKQ